MSLINRMLQDLDRRGATDARAPLLPEGVRVVGGPDTARRRPKWLLVALAGLVLAGALAWGLAGRLHRAAPAAGPGQADSAQPGIELRPSMRVELPPEAPRAAPAEHAHALHVLRGEHSPAAPRPQADPAPVPVADGGKVKFAEAAPAGEAPMKRVSPGQQAEFLYQKALSLLQQGRVTEAQDSLKDALVVDSVHAAARRLLAGLLVEAKRYAEAEQVLAESLRLGVEEADSAMALARLRVERGDVGGGLDLLQKHLFQGAGIASYQAFLATLLQRQGQHHQAAEHFRAALRLSPGNGPWLAGMGVSLDADGRPTEALDAFRSARSAGNLSPELAAFVDQRIAQLRVQQP
jgi:MSHA biogenesis protein MshN